MSIREEVMTLTARAQRGMSVKPGDRFVRGVEVVDVIDVVDGLITWESAATGTGAKGDRRAFTGRALRRVKAPPAINAGDLLDAVWALAGARSLSTDSRLSLIRQLYPEAYRGTVGTPTERATIAAWLKSLRAGTEPEQRPKIEVPNE